ncbi:MAG: lysylphosphatidylglycerol synthase transmembrane domain-containing protein [Verrucomicrobia bacterium]|nr:lysylphosphatidylglycerol synthase transmembrane domain-containing protein [Verrucomicrobiota bacterium]
MRSVAPADDSFGESHRVCACIRYGLRLAVSLAVLLWLVRTISWAEIRTILQGANPSWLSAGCALTLPIIFLRGFKWWWLLKDARLPVSMRRTVISTLAGLGFGLVTPGRAGELARIGYLGLGRDQAIHAGVLVVVDRITDLLALLLLLSISVFAFAGVGWGIAYVLAGGVGLLVLGRLMSASGSSAGEATTLRRKILTALRALPPGQLLKYTFVGLVAALTGVTMVYVLLNALVPAPYGDCLQGLPIVFMNGLLPVSIGGVGIREALMTLVFTRLGIDQAAAVSAIFVYFVFSMALPGMIGLLMAARPIR